MSKGYLRDSQAVTEIERGENDAPGKGLSKLANNITQSNAERLGDFQKGINGDRPICTLDLTDVNGVQIGLLRQFLLAEARFLAIGADVFTDQFAVFGTNCHSQLAEQEAAD